MKLILISFLVNNLYFQHNNTVLLRKKLKNYNFKYNIK